MSVKWDIGFEIILVSEIQHILILWGGITMKFKIGFSGYEEEQQTAEQLAEMPGEMQPVKSVVQVRFRHRLCRGKARGREGNRDRAVAHVQNQTVRLQARDRGCRHRGKGQTVFRWFAPDNHLNHPIFLVLK